jgi:hypothetical protein
MAYVAVSRSPIHVREVQGPVDPGFGVGDGDHISTGPVHPGGPVDPGFGVGLPPFGVTLPETPPGVWPPPSFNHPWFPIPPDAEEPPEGGEIYPPVGNNPPDGKFWVVCGIPGVGWRYVCVDPSLRPEKPPEGSKPPTSAPKV